MTNLAPAGSAVLPDLSLSTWVEQHSEQPVRRCYQCSKCSVGCPVADQMDLKPHQLIRAVHLGQINTLLNSRTIWVCAACRTCKSRCPNGIDTAAVADALKERALAQGIKPALPNVAKFHQAFLKSVAGHGRVHELGMMMEYKLKSATYFQDVPMGIAMFLKGKFKVLPDRIKGRRELQEIFKRAKGWKP